MPGTALVTINDNQWSVEVARTPAELTTGLAGVASIPAGTGMLFILPVKQVVTVDTTQMLFPIDIIFIKDDTVLSIASNIPPGYLVEEATPCDGFLEVNALEADLVEVGDIISVEITTIQEPVGGFDFSSIIGFAIPLAILGFVSGMFGSSSKKNNPKQLKSGGSSGNNPNKEYYWEIIDIETGEIIQKGKPYTTGSKALVAARSYQKGRGIKEREHPVAIRIYDTPNMEEWGKTIKYVMEGGMHRGIPLLIGKTPLQEEALDRLWPYGIKEIHSDGDLTVISQGRKWVVTTEGGVFKEEDVIPAGGYMIEIPLEQEWKQWERKLKEGYGEYRPGVPTEQIEQEIEVIPDWVRKRWLKEKMLGEHSIHGEPRQRLVDKYGSWAVGRAEAICPEDDVACVTRESKRLIETVRTRYGEEAEYVTITAPGKTVFHVGDTVSIIALERENKRVRELGEREATHR